MNCSYDKEKISMLAAGMVDEAEKAGIEFHLSGCPSCMAEFKASKKLWSLMAQSAEPAVSADLQTTFNRSLSSFARQQHSLERKNSWQQFVTTILHAPFKPQLAFSVLLLGIGLLGGWLLHSGRPAPSSTGSQVDSLSNEITELRQMVMLSLLDNPSAAQRLQAVAYTDELDTVNKKVVTALLTTLNEDPNVNVRLVTLEALSKLANRPAVREGLIESISKQDSPLLQSAIADVMVKLREKKSIQSLQQLLHKKDLNQMVRTKIEESIRQII